VTLFSLGSFFGLGDATDELHKTITIPFRRNGRYLGFVVSEAFDEVFHALDEGILRLVNARLVAIRIVELT
jgi:hypothetical protein